MDSPSDDDSISRKPSDNLFPRVPNLVPSHLFKQHPIFTTVKKVLDAIKEVSRYVKSPLSNPEFYRAFYYLMMNYAKEHPYNTAFFLIGVVFLFVNPLALAGFGALGPTAGSLAAGWMAAHGGAVAAGSAFAILQSIGMTWGVFIFPVIGASLVAGAGVYGLSKKIVDECKRIFGASASDSKDNSEAAVVKKDTLVKEDESGQSESMGEIMKKKAAQAVQAIEKTWYVGSTVVQYSAIGVGYVFSGDTKSFRENMKNQWQRQSKKNKMA